MAATPSSARSRPARAGRPRAECRPPRRRDVGRIARRRAREAMAPARPVAWRAVERGRPRDPSVSSSNGRSLERSCESTPDGRDGSAIVGYGARPLRACAAMARIKTAAARGRTALRPITGSRTSRRRARRRGGRHECRRCGLSVAHDQAILSRDGRGREDRFPTGAGVRLELHPIRQIERRGRHPRKGETAAAYRRLRLRLAG